MGSYLENEVFTLGRIPAIPSRFAPADPDAILFSIPHHLCLLSNLKTTFFRCDPVIVAPFAFLNQINQLRVSDAPL